jgi:hypothetical protein
LLSFAGRETVGTLRGEAASTRLACEFGAGMKCPAREKVKRRDGAWRDLGKTPLTQVEFNSTYVEGIFRK